MKPALLVIGPSRSGSSALTAVLAMRGASLPATLIPPGPGNPHGHFEPQRLMELNEEILAAHGSGYWDPIAIPPAWFHSAEAAAFTSRIAETITAEYGDAALPIIKDPRLCRLAPLYIAALYDLGLAPHAIIPLRHPGEAARSLTARDHTPAETAELLQLRELLGAERHTSRLPRAWSRYDHLLTDWRGTTEHIAATLNLAWPIPPDDAAAAITAFLAPSLRHHTPETATAGPITQRLYAAAISADEPTIRAAFDAIRTIIDETDRLIDPWQSAGRTRLATLESTARALTAERARLESLLSAREADLAIIRALTSWRLTAPLRVIGRWLGKHPWTHHASAKAQPLPPVGSAPPPG